MRVVTIVGARPQFIKAAPVSRQLRLENQEILVHTGQHYDYQMSQVFFEELDIPHPEVNLGIGSASHGKQTGEMLAAIERVLLDEEPDCVLVYGDTNSTLAGALAAVKLHIPVAHVEAGLRSFNREMPEEVNRIVTDHLSDLLFCPTETAVQNLYAEGIKNAVYNVGDVMYDAVLYNSKLASKRTRILEDQDLTKGNYLLATLHRPRNTDDSDRLLTILKAFESIGELILFPAHPRTKKAIETQSLQVPANVKIMHPVGYLDMLLLEQNAKVILTDSGGVQKEAYFFGVPCITLREETEWVETVQTGWNHLVGADHNKIISTINNLHFPTERPYLFGDGNSAEKVVTLLMTVHQT